MDLVALLEQALPVDNTLPPERRGIDAEYLKKLCNMPQSMLQAEQGGLASRLTTCEMTEQELGAVHGLEFVDTRKTMEAVAKLARQLAQAALDGRELSVATPRVPDRAFQQLKALVEDDLVVYNNIDKVQELLSLPEVVRDCVLNGNYGNALELASMTRRLHKRYPQSMLIAQLRSDVQRSVDSMREILLQSLAEVSRLPLLTRTVNYLRQLQLENEQQEINLEQVFLDSRWKFMDNQWGALPAQLRQTQAFAHLKRFVEIYREQVFATINGFQVIFQQSDSSEALAIFARKSLVRLLAELREQAPLVKNASDRASLWLQLAFCANSLGRVGANFWSLMDEDILSRDEWTEALQHQQDMARRASTYVRH